MSLAAAGTIAWQAAIVGAGPAGSATAIRLARAGWKVLLIERAAMPRPKVCGCCLSTRAHAELRRLFPSTIGPSVLGEVPLTQVRLVAAAGCTTLPLPAGGVLSRDALDTALVREAIAAGAAWLPHADVMAIGDEPSASEPLALTCRDATSGQVATLPASHAVIAAGLVDHIRVGHETARRMVHPHTRIGIGGILPADALDLATGELVMAVGQSGYCGIVRLDDGRLDLAAAVDRRVVAAGPHAAIGQVLDEADAPRHGIAIAPAALAAADLRATPGLTHTAPLVAGPTRRIFRVGDAAGYVEPFTGEGMGWALSSGRILATALLDGTDPAAAYERAHARSFRGLHGRCRRIAAAIRHPRLVGSAVRVAAAAPWAARRLVPLVVGASAHGGSRR